MESKQELEQMLLEIAKWENAQRDLWFWEKLGRLPFVWLDRLTPAFVQEKLGAAIDELASFLETGGKFLTDERAVRKRFAELPGLTEVERQSIADGRLVNLSIARMDSVAGDIGDSRARFATIQGATTGFGGLFTLAADIPLLIGTSLKTLQEIAFSYGYDPHAKEERLFIVKCLQFSSSDYVGKKAILSSLEAFTEPEGKVRDNLIAELQGWREMVLVYTENFGWKKLFQLVPIAGMVFGGYLNRKTVEDTAEAGRMLYKKRRALERLRENG
ncbi:UNVERIFIED_CONTAM: hypothetical protein ABID98_000650 [Brevibacillus sp. OAP136]